MAMSFIRSFTVVLLCVNPVMVLASQQRPLPIPNYMYHLDGDNKNAAVRGLMLASFFPKIMDSVDFSTVRTALESIDVSGAKELVYAHRLMLSLAVGATALLLLTKKLKDSEKFGPWCSENYSKVTGSLGETKKNLVGKLPSELQTTIWLCGKPFGLFYDLLKRYILLSQATIMSSITSPVVGKLLDYGFACPIPFCSFTALGWASSGVILTKGYFDQSFEESRKLHEATQAQVQQLNLDNKKEHATTRQQLAEVSGQVAEVSGKVAEIKEQIEGVQKELSQKIDGTNTQVEQLRAQNIEAHDKTQKQVGGLSEQMGGFGNKLEQLSGELTQATAQMVELNKDRDEKDKGLLEKIEATNKEFASVQENFVRSVTALISSSSEETKKAFETINTTISQVNVRQSGQGTVLVGVQEQISRLLDKRNEDEKRAVELLDAVKASNISLADFRGTLDGQKTVLKALERGFQEIQGDRANLLESIQQSIEQCSSVSERLSNLENKVDKNYEYVQQVNSTVIANHKEVVGFTDELLHRVNVLQEMLIKKIEEEETKDIQWRAEVENRDRQVKVLEDALNKIKAGQKKAWKDTSAKLDLLLEGNYQTQSKSPQIADVKDTERQIKNYQPSAFGGGFGLYQKSNPRHNQETLVTILNGSNSPVCGE